MEERLIENFEQAIKDGTIDEFLNHTKAIYITYIINNLVDQNMHIELIDKMLDAVKEKFDGLPRKRVERMQPPFFVGSSRKNGEILQRQAPTMIKPNFKIYFYNNLLIDADGVILRKYKDMIKEKIRFNQESNGMMDKRTK